MGSASALVPEDVVFAQYRETGVFRQRGFTLDDFMNQLFANSKDTGRGRNMPVHYGSSKLNIVQHSSSVVTDTTDYTIAHNILPTSNSNPPSCWRRLCLEDPSSSESKHQTPNCCMLLWRRRRQRGGLPCRFKHRCYAVMSSRLHMPQQRLRYLDADSRAVPR